MRNETGYIKYLTDDEFKKIKQFVNKLQSPSMRMCIKIMMYLGLRVGESIRLKRNNFNQNFSLLTYVMQKSKKVKERIVPESLRKELAKYYQTWHHRCIDGYLFFPSYRNQSKNKHLQRNSIGLKFRDLRKTLDLDYSYYTSKNGQKFHRLSPHTLRHYAIWKYYQASGNCLITARDMIGHSKIETTAKYIRSVEFITNEKEIIEKAFTD